jgi:hypothetical protein
LIHSSYLSWRLVSYLTRRPTWPCGIVSKVDHRSAVLDLHLKGLSAHGIHDSLVATLGPNAVAYSRVTRYLREAQPGTAEVTLRPEPSSPHLDDSDRVILAALDGKSFSSMREFARAIHIPPATIYRRLTKLLGCVRRPLRWVPHRLSDAQKVWRVELCLSLS